jgi:hypothetical protein
MRHAPFRSSSLRLGWWPLGTIVLSMLSLGFLTQCGVESLPEQYQVLLEGTIIDKTSSPKSGVKIQSDSQESTSDEDGTFRISLPLIIPVSLSLTIDGNSYTVLLEQIETQGRYAVTIRAGSPPTVLSLNLLSPPAQPSAVATSPSQPSEAPARTPSDTPAPQPSRTNDGPFDTEGNTTRFGIPRGTIGNKNRGRPSWQQNCGRCHGELGRRWEFNRLKVRIAEPPMNLRYPDSELADIVAYLNR